ncbi:MAG: hypothetical protein AAFU79_13500 [Myxococcota bacterium]
MFRTLIVSTAVAAWVASACTDQTQSLDPVPDAGVAADAGSPPTDAGFPDMGIVDVDSGVPPDLGPPDTGVEPQRRLVTYSFLGTTSVNNLVMAPFFDTSSSVGPASTRGTVRRQVRFDTPTRTPSLRLTNGAEVLLFVQGRPAPLFASIWVGQPANASFNPVQVTLLGLGATELQTGERLEEDPTSEQVIGDLRWRRFQGALEQDLLGNAFMFVQSSRGTVHLAGPEVTQLQTRGKFVPATRTLTLDAESRDRLLTTWKAWADAAQRQLTPVAPRLSRDAPLPFRAPPL